MGWEQRGGRAYYYTAERVGGRVVKRYVGGAVAGLAARMAAIERDKRLADRESARAAREAAEALDSPVAELDEVAGLVARAALLAAGYHQHNRGEWRKCRDRAEDAG